MNRRSLITQCCALALWAGCIGSAVGAPRTVIGETLNCAQATQLRHPLPAAGSGLRVWLSAQVPPGALLELRELGQNITLSSSVPQRVVQVPPRYGVYVFRVQQPMAFDLDRERPGDARGAVALRLHCQPDVADRIWDWYGRAGQLTNRLAGGVGSLSEDFPAALLNELERTAPDPGTHALAQHLSAQAAYVAGRAADASEAFARAASAWQALGDAERASAARVGVAEDLNRIGNYSRVLQISRDPTDAPDGTHYFGVRLEVARCLALHYLGRLDESASCYTWTSERHDALGESLDLASTGIDFASVEIARGRYDSAQRLLLLSVDLAQGAHSLSVQGRAQFELAGLARLRGDVVKALDRLHVAQMRFSEATERRWEVNVLLRQAALLNELRAPGEARAAAEHALSMLDARQAPARVAAAEFLLARIELNDGQAERGLRRVDAALAAFNALKMPDEVTHAAMLRARLLVSAGRHAEAQSAVAVVPGGESMALPMAAARQLVRAELALHAGDAREAARALRALGTHLTWSEQLDRTRLLAEVEWQSGRREQAHSALQAGARALAASSRGAGNTLLAHVLSDSIDTFRQSAVDLIARELESDGSRAATAMPRLLPWLHDAAPTGNADLRDQSRGEVLNGALSALLLAQVPGAMPLQVDADADSALHSALLGELARGAQRFDAPPSTAELGPNALRQLAQPGRPLLLLLRGRSRLLRVWIEAAAEPRWDSLDIHVVQAQLGALRAQLVQRDGNLAQIDSYARELSASLLEGLGSRAAPHQLRVLGSPIAAAIPWPLLYWPQDTQPLVDRSAVSLLRLTVAPAQYADPTKRIDIMIAAQNGTFATRALPELVAAPFEETSIRRQSPGFRVQALAAAGREQLLARLAAPGAWLHVSAHGTTRSDRLVASGIWLDAVAPGRDAGFLSWVDVLERGVGAELVVLNACQLAQNGSAAADAALDFAGAVSRAGAHHTVAAQWPISDAASAVWVPAFYRTLSAGGTTPDPAQALAEARRALRASRAFRHPFHWAGWVHWERVAVAPPTP